MAANFWASSHFKQLMEQEEVDVVPQLDKERGLTLEEFKLVKVHMTNYIAKLAQHVKVRQRVVATAVSYFRRVYTRKSMTEYDPRLVAPSCLYLASKAEESTVQARLLAFYIKKICLDDKHRYEIKDILEMEMKILEALDYYLVIYHPYRALTQLLQDAGMADLTHPAWGIVNDTYRMDLILVHPPYMIALASIYIATVIKEKDATSWFEELRVDMNVVKNISMEILDFYDSYRQIPDERITSVLNKLRVKPSQDEASASLFLPSKTSFFFNIDMLTDKKVLLLKTLPTLEDETSNGWGTMCQNGESLSVCLSFVESKKTSK